MTEHPEPIDPDVDAGSQPTRAPAGWGATLGVIAVGGMLGALARYGLGLAWPAAPERFPWATLVINVSGCLVMGALVVLVSEVFTAHPLVRPFAGTGFLGGFTTFSTYGADIVRLAQAHRPGTALGYLALTAVAALLAVAVGALGTRRLLVGRI